MGAFDDLPEAAPGPAGSPVAGAFADLPEEKAGGPVAAAFADLPGAEVPRLSQAPEPGVLSKTLRALEQNLAPLIGPSEEMRGRQEALVGEHYMGDAIQREGLFPALARPFVELPRGTQETARKLAGTLNAIRAVPQSPEAAQANAEKLVGTYNALAGFAEFAESPLGVATAGAGTAAVKLGLPWLRWAISGAYALDIGRKVPEQARQAGALDVTGTPVEQAESKVSLAVSVGLPAVLGREALKRRARKAGDKTEGPSEFGDRKAPEPAPEPAPPSGQGEGAKAAPVAAGEEIAGPARALKQPAAVETARAGEAPGETRREGSAILDDTVQTALQRRDAIPQGLIEAWNATHEVELALPKGYEREGERWVYKQPEAELTQEQIWQREREEANRELREIKAQEEAERQAADNRSPAVIEAEGKVGAAELDRRAKVLRDDPQAPPEFSEEAAREMAAKLSVRGQWIEPEWTRTRIAEPGTPQDPGERPPDILDWLEGNGVTQVKFSSKADLGDMVGKARGRAREMMSFSRGRAADEVLRGELSRELGRIQSEEDLAQAMARAGAARIGWAKTKRAASKQGEGAREGGEGGEELREEPPTKRLAEPSGSRATLDGVAEDLYGKAYEALTPDQQGMVRVTVESENNALQRRKQLDRTARRELPNRGSQPGLPDRTGGQATAPQPAAQPERALQPAGPASSPGQLSEIQRLEDRNRSLQADLQTRSQGFDLQGFFPGSSRESVSRLSEIAYNEGYLAVLRGQRITWDTLQREHDLAKPVFDQAPKREGIPASRQGVGALQRLRYVDGAVDALTQLERQAAVAKRIKAEARAGKGGVTRLEYVDGKQKVGSARLIGSTIGDIEVRPGKRRKGYGRAILQDLRRRGGRTLFAGSAAGERLARSAGMVEVGAKRFAFPEQPAEQMQLLETSKPSATEPQLRAAKPEAEGKTAAPSGEGEGEKTSPGATGEEVFGEEPRISRISRIPPEPEAPGGGEVEHGMAGPKRNFPGYTLEQLKSMVANPALDEPMRQRLAAEVAVRESGVSVPRITPQIAPSWKSETIVMPEVEHGMEKPAAKGNRDWDELYDNLIGTLDSFNPARTTGRINYELEDLAQRFVDYAKRDNSGLPLNELVREFAKSDEASAGQIRKLSAAVKAEAGRADPIERALDRTIEALRDPQGQMLEGVTGAPVWITRAALRGALQVGRFVYVTTRDAAKAVVAAVDHLRSLNLAGYNEAQARAWLEGALLPAGSGVRQTGEKLAASPDVSAAARGNITEWIYQKRANATDESIAADLLRERGLDGALELYRRTGGPGSEIPGAVRSRLLGVISRELDRVEREQRAAGDAAGAEATAERLGAFWDEALAGITDTAQALQALNEIIALSPDAQVARVRRRIQRAGNRELDERAGEVGLVRTATDEGRAAGVEEIKADAASNRAARAAVDEQVAGSAETRAAVLVELAAPWSQSSAVLEHARRQVRAKAEELMNRGPKPPGLTPAKHLRRIMDDLAQRAAGIAAGHYQGAEPGKPLARKLQERLGISREKALSLAKQLDAEWARAMKAELGKLPGRIAAQREAMARREGLRPDSPGHATAAAIRQQLERWKLELGKLLEAQSGALGATGRSVADALVDQSGLKGAAAEALRRTLAARWEALVKAAQEKRLAELEKASGLKVGGGLRGLFYKLAGIGRVPENVFAEMIRQKLKLPKLSEADARELRRLVQIAQGKPEGWQRQQEAHAAMTFAGRLEGRYGWVDLPWGIWYANIFSALPTHLRNTLGNGLKLVETLGQEIAHRPAAAGLILRSLARGGGKGLAESGPLLRTGVLTGTRLLTAEAARPLEALRLPGGWDYLLTPLRLVGRALATEDLVPFKAHEEIKWALIARQVARAEGLPMWGPRLEKRVQELLHHTQRDRELARTMAAQEGLSGLSLVRRVNELAEQWRERDMPGSAANVKAYALKQTYNAEPYGLVGMLAAAMNDANRRLVVTRFAMPVVRILANLTNESLNYFPPVGLARVALARWGPAEALGGRARFRNRLDGQPLRDADQMWNATAQAAAGTAILGGLAMFMAQTLDDDDPPIAVYGQGPRTRKQREQLRGTGWRPNTIKIEDKYYGYQESQLALPLAMLGNYFDALRWKDLDEQDAINRAGYAMQTFTSTLLDRRMLSGVKDMLDAFAADSTKTSAAAVTKLLARPASGFVVPNAARWLDQVFDPQVYDSPTVQGQLLAQVPVARRLNRPALNVFGDPVTRRWTEAFVTKRQRDELAAALASKQAWVPVPDLGSATVGEKAKGPDYYRPMTEAEYYEWIREAGPRIRERLTKALDSATRTPSRIYPALADAEPDEARALVRRVAQQEYEQARKRLGFTY